MNIKKLNEKLQKVLNEVDWDNRAAYSLPNGDKDDVDTDEFEYNVIDRGNIVINILGTDIEYKVFEHKYFNPQQDKLFGGVFIEAPDNINDLTNNISNIIYTQINEQFEEKFSRKIDYENEPTFIKIPRHLVAHNN